MNSREVHELLIVASGIDRRVISEPMLAAWHEALADVDYAAARRALAEHRRTSTEYVLPAHIVALIRAETDLDEIERIMLEEEHERAEWLARAGLSESRWRDLVAAHGVSAAGAIVNQRLAIEAGQ